ncbi:MAG: MoaD/ThiS family protein [Bacteroidota bacterium]
MAKIIIPTPLRKFTDNQSTFETQGDTVKAAIVELTQKYQGLSRHLLDAEDNIRSFIRIFIGDEDINALQKEATSVEPNSIISIVPAIAGGIN